MAKKSMKHAAHPGHVHAGRDPSNTDALAKDPVCGMSVDPATAKYSAEHDGERYFFCSAGCREKFLADPARHLAEAPRPQSPARAGAVYVCPMHPQIRRDRPGACPICGMALEPEVPTATDEPDGEREDMTRRFWIALVLTAPLVLIDMGAHALDLLGLHQLITPSVRDWIELSLSAPVVLWAGAPFFARAWASIVSRNLNMFTLIALGAGVAFLTSVVAILTPALFPSSFRDAHGAAPVYFEAAAVITTLVLLGQVLELGARARTGAAIRALIDLAPKTARRLRPDGGEEEAPVETLSVGDRLRVRPGEKAPVDGLILEGASTLDESLLTGESAPVAKKAGDKVIGGAINGDGAFIMRAERIGADTMLARIVAMVASAQRSRAPIQRLADHVAGWFVPLVIAVAIASFAAWAIFGPAPRFAYGLVAAVSVLIIACPCALGLATPMSIMVGIGRGAREGLLIKNAEALERLQAVDTLALDKTGTLTEGKPRVVAVRTAAGVGEGELLRLAASLEGSSGHPLAAAIVRAAQERGLQLGEATEFDAPAGKGLTGKIDGRRIALGAERFLRERGVDLTGLVNEAASYCSGGATLVFVAIDVAAAGFIAVADPIKATTPEALAVLRALGLRVIMLTGDSAATARAIAEKLGLAEAEAELTPEDKAVAVARLRQQGRVVAMAGDGVNDAPALAAADVGIAMGAGADVAIESAGVTLLGGDLRRLVAARLLSQATMRNIRQNLFFAFIYNALGVPIAAGALYPIWGITLSPIVAAAAMALSSVSVIANALRLRGIAL
jgi:Cu+-exporting ATPase